MRPILFCLLAIVSAPAWSEWKEVVKNSDASYYIDPATIRKNEMLVRVWSIQNCSGLIAMDTLMGGLSTCRGEIDEREAQEV